MSNFRKFLVAFVLVAAAAGGVFYFLNGNHEVAVAPSTLTQTDPAADTTDDPTVKPVETASVPKVQDPQRTEVNTGGNREAPQGVRGRLLLPNGQPASAVTVLLVESTANDPLQILIRNKMGLASPTLASTTTAADGTFALGVAKADQTLDLRVVTDDYPQLTRGGIKVLSQDWYDAGNLQLEQGLVVQGRVVNASSKLPIAGATVFMANSHQSHVMVATPGRERGTPTVTDDGGFFRFDNGPRQGLVNIVCEAEGYAAGQLLNQQLKPDAPNEFMIEIEVGRSITGVVVDQQGQRISGAKITAAGLSAKTPQTESTISDGDGVFEFPSLRNGPYKLSASASRYANTDLELALTGEDVKIVMATRGSVKLKVLGHDQRPVKVYRISLKRSFPNQPSSIGNVLEYPDRNINPGDYPSEYKGEWALISGLPTGDYRFQIIERNHAKTLSPTFKIEQGADPVEVTAVLTLGASITGTVIDDRGQPVAGAAVVTDMNAGIAANTGIFDIFRSMMPEKHTTRTERTDAQGRFRVDQLSFADYMLRVAHPAYCEGVAIDITLDQEGQVKDAGVIQLSRGAVFEGLTTVAGQPAGQVKVVVSVPFNNENVKVAQDGAKQPGQSTQVLFSANVLSDGDGRYKLLKRVPPGRYKVTAARHSAENPFGALMDMKETEQEITVQPGQERVELNFNLSGR